MTHKPKWLSKIPAVFDLPGRHHSLTQKALVLSCSRKPNDPQKFWPCAHKPLVGCPALAIPKSKTSRKSLGSGSFRRCIALSGAVWRVFGKIANCKDLVLLIFFKKTIGPHLRTFWEKCFISRLLFGKSKKSGAIRPRA